MLKTLATQVVCLLVPAVFAVAAETNRLPVVDTLTDAQILAMFQEDVEVDHNSVGLAAGIVDTNGAHIICYGQFDNGTGRTVDGDTLFEIGSVTKVFTGLLLQDMLERGEMHLDDPVQKYLPASVKVPTYEGKPILLRHLATHTSGLPRDTYNLSPAIWSDNKIEEFYTALSHCKLTRAPGSKQEYSNLGVGLLGHLIALKAGTNYETLVRERICRPLGMDSTCVIVPPQWKSRLATGHILPGWRRPYFLNLLPGAGCIRSSLNDLLKFAAAYAGVTNTPLTPLMERAQAFHDMETGPPQRLIWGGYPTILLHGGQTYGYSSMLAFDVRDHRAVVILSSTEHTGFVAVWPCFYVGKAPTPTNAAPANPALFTRYTGQYETTSHELCNIRREGDRLFLQWRGKPGDRTRYLSAELFPMSETVFRNEFYDDTVTFLPATNRQPTRLILEIPEHRLELARVSPNVPVAPAPFHPESRAYGDYVGQYRWTTLFKLIRIGPTLSVFHKTNALGDHLTVSVPALFGDGDAEFYPEAPDTFVNNPDDDDNIRLSFVRDRQGRVKRVNVDWNGTVHRGSRISEGNAR